MVLASKTKEEASLKSTPLSIKWMMDAVSTVDRLVSSACLGSTLRILSQSAI